jgi:hypothetical protein
MVFIRTAIKVRFRFFRTSILQQHNLSFNFSVFRTYAVWAYFRLKTQTFPRLAASQANVYKRLLTFNTWLLSKKCPYFVS